MNRTLFISAALILAGLPVWATLTFAGELKPVQLLKPQVEQGRPLMQALKDRSSSRSFSKEKLPLQVLSNLLWAAFGVNRQDSGKRTAPSAMNWQEIEIYVAAPEGLYLYNARAHVLDPILPGDIRAMTGRQEFVKDAPVNLIYVADYSRMGTATKEDRGYLFGRRHRFHRRECLSVLRFRGPGGCCARFDRQGRIGKVDEAPAGAESNSGPVSRISEKVGTATADGSLSGFKFCEDLY